MIRYIRWLEGNSIWKKLRHNNNNNNVVKPKTTINNNKKIHVMSYSQIVLRYWNIMWNLNITHSLSYFRLRVEILLVKAEALGLWVFIFESPITSCVYIMYKFCPIFCLLYFILIWFYAIVAQTYICICLINMHISFL